MDKGKSYSLLDIKLKAQEMALKHGYFVRDVVAIMSDSDNPKIAVVLESETELDDISILRTELLQISGVERVFMDFTVN